MVGVLIFTKAYYSVTGMMCVLLYKTLLLRKEHFWSRISFPMPKNPNFKCSEMGKMITSHIIYKGCPPKYENTSFTQPQNIYD